jgi:hypothetical protein
MLVQKCQDNKIINLFKQEFKQSKQEENKYKKFGMISSKF